MTIRIGILGYGNLGRGVEQGIKANTDMELVAVFTRRNPEDLKIATAGVPVVSTNDIDAWKDKIDVMVLCGGSATDLPEQSKEYVKHFNIVDSFDTHAHIPEHFAAVDAAAKQAGHIGIISVGWDPGLFSLARIYANAVLPQGQDYTFWGRGVSQGHSDAIRRIQGVKDARQYTVPIDAAVDAVRAGENPELTTRQKHARECYVVLGEDGDAAYVEKAIKTMPDYFADYDTSVTFISQEEMNEKHNRLPHGGSVIRSGITGQHGENKHVVEFKLTLDSNPEFTASVLLAYARAAHRLALEGQNGCRTVLDIAPVYLSMQSNEELRKHLL